MTKNGERKIEYMERAHGGAGHIAKEPLLNGEELGQYCNLFARIIIPPFCELGHHEHHDETETYFIVSGTGMYDDNGKAVPVEAGDVVFCKNGDGHGIKNTGSEDLVFVALILKE